LATYSGRYAKVQCGSTLVVGQGEWNMEGVTVDQIDTTAFGSVWKTFEAGMSDGGQITFSGYYDATDSGGQSLLITANQTGSQITNIRFYIDSTSFYLPATTNPVSFVLITQYSITHKKDDIARVSFTAKISGKLLLQ
jgi:hypothetical protein